MKFTLSWLKEHLETDARLDEILYALTDLGLEVEGVENPAERLRAFTIGHVKSAEKHPDADKLKVCQVDTADGPTQIICGAPNARAGITVVVAKPGVYVPGIDTTIGVGKIRGVESYGMMCSEREMELSEEHDGIIELPSGEVGQSFVDWLTVHDPAKTDPVIEIAITPNRPDALGVRGIARDLSARGLGTLKAQEQHVVQGKFPCPIKVSIDQDTLGQAPVFFGRVIKGVKNGPSPKWLQARLRAIGLRPISALVDITNFFTFDSNRPLHVFDADKVAGQTLRVHRAKGGEVFSALDEKEYTLEADMTAISDANGVESLAGIMGGADSGCTYETVNVFLEAAFFDPVRTAYSGRALKINSDARYRFERGIDPEWTPQGIELATQMILDLCGGEASDIVTAGNIPDHSRSYRFDPTRLKSLVGMEMDESAQRAALEALGFVLENDMAKVPAWRPDIMGEADLIEEVARIASLTRLKGQPLPPVSEGVTKVILSPMQKRAQVARRTAAMLGYNECVSYSFIDQKTASLFGQGDARTEVDNPISSDMSHMRPSILGGLLHAARRNQARGFSNLALFEVGPVFHGSEPGEETVQLAGLLIGNTGPKNVHSDTRAVDIFDVKADIEAILSAIGAPSKMQVLRQGESWWHPGRHGRLCLGPKKTLGVFGEIHPKILNALDVKGPAVGFTIELEAIPMPRQKSATRDALIMSDLQSVERDFAFVVEKDTAAIDLVNAAAGADKKHIRDVRVFDEFFLQDGKKSIAISARFEPQDKTFEESEIEKISQAVVEKVLKATGGTLRG